MAINKFTRVKTFTTMTDHFSFTEWKIESDGKRLNLSEWIGTDVFIVIANFAYIYSAVVVVVVILYCRQVYKFSYKNSS